MKGKIDDSNLKKFAGVFAALGLYAPTLSVVFFNHFEIVLPRVATALYLYIFSLTSLFLTIYTELKITKAKKISILILMLLVIVWMLNLLKDYAFGVVASEYDEKRPLFMILALIYGWIGLINCGSKIFLYGFFRMSMVMTILICINYLLRYDPISTIARIDGDVGLMVGHLCVQGLGAIFALTYNKEIKNKTNFIFTIIVILAILGSGTRSAVVSFFVIIILYVVIQDKKESIKLMLPLLFLMLMAYYYVGEAIPEHFLERITNFNLEGSEDRGAMILIAISSLIENPFGKIIGYLGVYPAEIEWSHNVIIQIIIEIGLLGMPLLLFILIFSIRGYYLVAYLYPNKNYGLIFYTIPVIISSLSTGDAYNPQFWFVSMFLFVLGFGLLRKNKNNSSYLKNPGNTHEC